MKNSNLKIVGLGPGNLDFLTGAGVKAILESEVIIGGKRQIEEIESLLLNQEKFYLKKLDEMKEFVRKNLDKKITFIVSGDTGYYSLLTYLKKSFEEISFHVIPGISSFQYLFSRIEMTWEHYSLHSVHGRDFDYVGALEKSKSGVVLLTDGENNPISISKNLLEKGIENVEVIVGERLSYPDECITRFEVKNYKNYEKMYMMNVTILRKI
nr:precorrin-6y C5,15-methyltransferase (decarboxylating) subunit CbiE [uncultured Cetobacterium sp.]